MDQAKGKAESLVAGEVQSGIHSGTSIDEDDGTDNTDENTKTFLEWVSPLNFTHMQSEYLSKQYSGTLEWFFDSPQYDHWLRENNENLTCHGKIGTGKTVLTSAVIADLSNRFENNEAYDTSSGARL
ncbi:hypothetical protein F4810DRAFT_719366 [Camillea tinctor]|nr:hypothetical protein F4810DRAFT_719366 [Camillea tinctor]